VSSRKKPERGAIYTPEYRVFISELRAARQRAGLTQHELAARLNKSQSFVAKAESGDRRVDIAQLVILCRAMDIPLTEFVHHYEAALQNTR